MKSSLMMATMVIAVLAGTAGYAAAQDYRYHDGDDHGYYDRDDHRYYDRDGDRYHDRYGDRDYNHHRGMHVAREMGFQDGSQMAREDMWRGKRFNSKPRGRYDDKDHGYRREFGSKHEYRELYADAYHAGYERTYRNGWGYR